MKKLSTVMIALMVGVFAAGCTAEVEDAGEMPDVNVEAGRMPDIDIDAAEVRVGTDTQTIIVPDIDVDAPRD